MNINKERILTEAEDDFIEALSNREYVNPYDSGRKAAQKRILSEVCNAYGVKDKNALPQEGKQTAWELWIAFERKRQDER